MKYTNLTFAQWEKQMRLYDEYRLIWTWTDITGRVICARTGNFEWTLTNENKS